MHSNQKENRKFVELESLITAGQDMDLGESKLVRDCKVQLSAGTTVNNKRGKQHIEHDLVKSSFCLVVVQSKAEEGKETGF